MLLKQLRIINEKADIGIAHLVNLIQNLVHQILIRFNRKIEQGQRFVLSEGRYQPKAIAIKLIDHAVFILKDDPEILHDWF